MFTKHRHHQTLVRGISHLNTVLGEKLNTVETTSYCLFSKEFQIRHQLQNITGISYRKVTSTTIAIRNNQFVCLRTVCTVLHYH